MKIYLASSGGPIVETLIFNNTTIHPHTLLSFHYKSLTNTYKKIWNTPNHQSIMLDSGAFSAWSLGKTIQLSAYADWANNIISQYKNTKQVINCINLDVIPGRKGTTSTKMERHIAIETSKQNASQLKNLGLPIMEVYHQDEDIQEFYGIIERNHNQLIAVSPRNDVSVNARQTWLYGIFAKIVQRYGKNDLPKCHGLGVTSKRLLLTFPFYSGDSASWVSCYIYGRGGVINKDRLPRYHASDLAKQVNIATLRASVKHYQNIQDTVTKIWAERGVIWSD